MNSINTHSCDTSICRMYHEHSESLISLMTSIEYSKPVTCLEFGCSVGSSSIFNYFVNLHLNLTVISYDDNADYVSSMRDLYGSDRYKFHTVSWTELDFGAFIDTYEVVFNRYVSTR